MSHSSRCVRVVMAAMILGAMLQSSGGAAVIHRKEGCAADFTCPQSQAPDECDNCTGFGNLSWTKSYTNCSSQTVSDTDCDGTTWDLAWGYSFCSVPAGQNTFDVDLDVSTKGAVLDSYTEDCGDGPTQYGCHWDILVHRQYEAQKIGNWAPDGTIRVLKVGPVLVSHPNIYSYQSGGSTTTTTTWTFSFEAGGKKAAVEAAIGGGFTYQSSTTQSFSQTASRPTNAADDGQYLGCFAEHQRVKVSVNFWEYGCGGVVEGPTAGTVYKTASPTAALNILVAPTIAGVLSLQQNEQLLSGGTVTGGP